MRRILRILVNMYTMCTLSISCSCQSSSLNSVLVLDALAMLASHSCHTNTCPLPILCVSVVREGLSLIDQFSMHPYRFYNPNPEAEGNGDIVPNAAPYRRCPG